MPVSLWTSEQDEALRMVMADCQGMSWPEVCMAAFPDGSKEPTDCIERWKQMSKPMQIKGPWSPEEDRQLIALVAELSTNSWGSVSRRIITRTGKQCRERWHNHLDPSINKRPFTAEEDQLILQLYDQFGPKWASISRHLAGRPDNSIKNHFNTTLHRMRGTRDASARGRRDSVSSTVSTATASTSTSSGSPAPSVGGGGRRRLNASVSDGSAPSSPRFTPYTRPRSGTDAALLPSPGIMSSRAGTAYSESGPTMLTRSQSNTDVPMTRGRSVRSSLQMTPARSLDPRMRLNLSDIDLHPNGFYHSGPATAPAPIYGSPARGSDMFDTWSTPPATPEVRTAALQPDYYFGVQGRASYAQSMPGVLSPSSSLQAALDDLILSPSSASTTRTASMMSRFSSSGSMPPSPVSPILTRSMSYAGGAPMSALTMYEAGLSGHMAMPMVMRDGSLPSPGMTTDYGSSSGHSMLSDALPMTPPRSTPSSCSASSNSLSSYPFDEHIAASSAAAAAALYAQSPSAHQRTMAPLSPSNHAVSHHTYGLRSSTVRDTPSPAKSDLTV